MSEYDIRASYAGKSAVKVSSKNSPAVAYVSVSAYSGRLQACGFYGKSMKPAFNYSFKSAESRSKWVAKWLADMDDLAARKNKAKAERKEVLGSKQDLIKVGDVLRCSWGYDQTNIDFYQVVECFGKRGVVICKIGRESVDTQSMAGRCVPAKDNFIGEPMRKQVSACGSVKISSYSNAYKMEPLKVAGAEVGYESSYWSAYA